ncbi:thioredoxin [Escherichia phage UPEC01]|nr:thioredoxin [Escherichia phage UPEC01]
MSQAINEIRSEVKNAVKFTGRIPSTKDVVLNVLYMMWNKFNVCTNSAEFTKIFEKTKGLLTLEDRVMKSLHRSGMLSRANAKIILKKYNKGYDLYGRAISTMTFDEVVKDLWKNQRRLLALGARLASGQDKQMTFKTNNSLDYKLFNVIKGQNEGEYSISSFSGCQYENWKFHLRLALSVLECHGVLTFYDVQTGGVQRIKLCQIKDQVEVESPSEQAPKMEPVPVRSNEKYSEQIELFTKQIEELNITIQQQDDEIFRLTGLNSAAKAERQKLMNVIELLKD